MVRIAGSIAIVSVVLAVHVGIIHARATPAQKCAAAKQMAAVKKVASKLKCHQKANARGVPVDQACLTTAERKFSEAITKAESRARGGCAVTGNEAAIEQVCDTCVDDIRNLTPVIPPTCGDGAYPQCGGTCPGGMSCQAFIRVHEKCVQGQGRSKSCSSFCQCVDPATACNGQACGRTCSLDTHDVACGNLDSAVCCSGLGRACDVVSGSPQCCCATSCSQPVGTIGACEQGMTCNATGTGTQCQ